MRRALLLGAVLALTVSGVAQAHRPPLTLATADHFANKQAQQSFDGYLCDATSSDPADLCLAGFEIDPCERLTPSSADCDVTYYYADGAEFDRIITVHSSRHDGIIIHQSQPSIPSD